MKAKPAKRVAKAFAVQALKDPVLGPLVGNVMYGLAVGDLHGRRQGVSALVVGMFAPLRWRKKQNEGVEIDRLRRLPSELHRSQFPHRDGRGGRRSTPSFTSAVDERLVSPRKVSILRCGAFAVLAGEGAWAATQTIA